MADEHMSPSAALLTDTGCSVGVCIVLEKQADQETLASKSKLEAYLRATSIAHEDVAAYPFQGPNGKAPLVAMPSGEKVPDSLSIVRHLKATGLSKDLDAGLRPAQHGWKTCSRKGLGVLWTPSLRTGENTFAG
ncbi:hypothetical protein OE88DRAFT_1722472 [Heliocybe sulcata]|uniref:Thioredoxin-like fold domain-containing protein n=1 Tax=Heliocybe sulcata TaxID=5364 RepID=A0A5C3NLC8_9AGAM|nr:hypothetical protein OE88DRAFT_1722472 [Heliocybe sulcata]